MTVREWFRVQRRNAWDRDRDRSQWATSPWSLMELRELIDKATSGRPLDLVESCGRIKLVFGRDEWERQQRVFAAVRDQLHHAMRELEREGNRRAAVERMHPEWREPDPVDVLWPMRRWP